MAPVNDAHWIPMLIGGKHSDTYICSKCHGQVTMSGGYKHAIDCLPRCENCGADMTRHVYNSTAVDYFGRIITATDILPINYKYHSGKEVI